MLRPTLLALLVTIAGLAQAAPVVFQDGTFADADWTSLAISFEVTSRTSLPGGDVSATQQPSGGNLGSFRSVQHIVPAAPSPTTFGATWSVHFHVGSVYDPSTQGAIASIDFDEDAQRLVGSNLGQSTGVAVRQGGRVFVHQVGATPESAWTHKQGRGIVASAFGEMDSGGGGTGKPDFSSTGGPIEFGFVRGNSTGAGGPSYSITGAIDNWRVRLNPPCTTPADCDDGDACTTDACASGACASTDVDCSDGDPCTTDQCAAGTCGHAPLDCDDGRDCTADACVAGTCQHPLAVSYSMAEAKAQQLLAVLQSKACAGGALSKRLVKKLRPKIAKLRGKVDRADGTTKAKLVARLVTQAAALLDAASGLVGRAVTDGLLSAACADELQAFLADIRQCVGR